MIHPLTEQNLGRLWKIENRGRQLVRSYFVRVYFHNRVYDLEVTLCTTVGTYSRINRPDFVNVNPNNSMDYKKKALQDTKATGGVVGLACGAAIVAEGGAACGFMGAFGVVAGAGAVGCAVLGTAFHAGTKWADNDAAGKTVIAASAIGVGAASGICVTSSVVAAATAPVLAVGAVVGAAVVGGAVMIGHLAAECDRKKTELELIIKKLEKEKKEWKQKEEEHERRLKELEKEREKDKRRLKELEVSN
ncbi:uncharacterized protein LOC110463709 [Mizuhopecten yessoensis]|uniref:uncharacterized protein LOC110463709 n=1 Tax=Mizuhopecten yessoensis TaxID=6573 RepID=UPI000B45EC02|nr:uncharacterized protein LOC110463709 [Mizuhopecten yessoensis]